MKKKNNVPVGTMQEMKYKFECKIKKLENEMKERDYEINDLRKKLKLKNALIKKLRNNNKQNISEVSKLTKICSKKESALSKANDTIKIQKTKIKQQEKIIKDLKNSVQELEKTSAHLNSKSKKMEEIIQDQDRRLDVHENAHVPPAKQGPLNQNGKGSKNKKGTQKAKGKKKNVKRGKAKDGTKRGGIKGHTGKTQIFKPTATRRHTAEKCPHCTTADCRCKGVRIRDINRDEKRTMVSIPEFIPHTVTRHNTARYACDCCKKEFKAYNGLPASGQFDWPVLRYVSYQYDHRKTADMVRQDLSNFYRLKITSETVRGIWANAMQYLKPLRDQYFEHLKNAPATLMDETDYEGEPLRWFLGVRDDDTAVFMQAPNRSARDLISQAIGIIGIITRDGYPGYKTIFPDNKKQRCTQHISREGRNIARRTDLQTANELYRELSEKFEKLRKWTRGKHTDQARQTYASKLQNWLQGIIARYRRCHHRLLKKFGTTLENAAPELFTFIVHPYVHSTTNLAEQSMQKVIGQRRSRRQLKSDEGAENLAIMLSCFETWKLRKLNIWDELCKILRPPATANI